MRENLKATKSFTYGGRFLKAGDPISASRADARLLRALGRAAPADTYQTTEAKAEVTKDQAPAEKAVHHANAPTKAPEQKDGAGKKGAAKKAAAKKAAVK